MAGRDRSNPQLPLDLPAAPGLRREDFLEAPSNSAALALIDSYPDWPALVVCLVGAPGTGKSHLAAVFAERAGAKIVKAADLARADVPDALSTGALVVEDVAPGGFDEAALFHVLNLAKETRAHVLMTARSAPSGFTLATPDLASRLRAVPKVEIAPADDALLAAVLVKLFADRQIPVDEGTVHYLLARMERSVAGAEALVKAIDRAALAARRPVTRAFAADVLRASEKTIAEDEDD
ncbi:chromosomal replication initiator DnaA [Aquabacter sp. CN5-332]|uniref:chromosomal replication initiator DnaA n=1 Tax=Aquabacter sp. CN5-332 TaxID=3156608 RepID=UPI0032B62841